jgi:hypothetical protein
MPMPTGNTSVLRFPTRLSRLRGLSASRVNLQRITNFLGLRCNTSLLLVTPVLAGSGERLWLGFAPKCLQTLGAGVCVIGRFDAVQKRHLYRRRALGCGRNDLVLVAHL